MINSNAMLKKLFIIIIYLFWHKWKPIEFKGKYNTTMKAAKTPRSHPNRKVKNQGNQVTIQSLLASYNNVK